MKEAIHERCPCYRYQSVFPKSFDAAIRKGLDRASKTLEKVKSACIQDQEVMVDDKGEIAEYQVLMKVKFILNN